MATKKTRFEIFAKQILAQRWRAIRASRFLTPGMEQISSSFFVPTQRAGAERGKAKIAASMWMCVSVGSDKSQGPSSLHQSKHHHRRTRFSLCCWRVPFARDVCLGALGSSARDKSIFVGDEQQCWRDDRWLLIMHLDFAERRDVRTWKMRCALIKLIAPGTSSVFCCRGFECTKVSPITESQDFRSHLRVACKVHAMLNIEISLMTIWMWSKWMCSAGTFQKVQNVNLWCSK